MIASSPAPFVRAATDDPLTPAADWMVGSVTGSLAVSLAIIAVAAIGLMIMAGRLPLRDGGRIVLGCFVLLGAPLIAAGLMTLAEAGTPPAQSPHLIDEGDPRAVLPPSTYDPYAGASIRVD